MGKLGPGNIWTTSPIDCLGSERGGEWGQGPGQGGEIKDKEKEKDKDKDKDEDKAVVAAFEAEVFQFITVALNSSSDAVNRTAAMLNKDDEHTAVLLDVLKEHSKNVTKAKLLLGKSVTIMKRNRSRSRSRAKSSKQ